MTTKEHLSQHDREIRAIRELIKTGLRLIVRIEQAQLKTEQAQLKTEKSLRELTDSLKRDGDVINRLRRIEEKLR